MLLAAAGILLSAQRSEAQTYVKLNGLYALVGVINPAVEFRLSPHSTFQSEFVCSPWHPHRRDEPEHPDPFNGSGEWLPNKIGVSIGLMIFNPDKHRKKR